MEFFLYSKLYKDTAGREVYADRSRSESLPLQRSLLRNQEAFYIGNKRYI